ncbi:MAG: DUF3850 domain-containing protein [Methanomassiliicoccales archaeon]
MEHSLKLDTAFFQAVLEGVKTFELRKNDRGFAVGDDMVLHEWKQGTYTGRSTPVRITYLLQDYQGLEEGFAILGIKRST